MRRNEMTPAELQGRSALAEMKSAVESMERACARAPVHFGHPDGIQTPTDPLRTICGVSGPGHWQTQDRTHVTCEACLKKLGLKRIAPGGKPAGFTFGRRTQR